MFKRDRRRWNTHIHEEFHIIQFCHSCNTFLLVYLNWVNFLWKFPLHAYYFCFGCHSKRLFLTHSKSKQKFSFSVIYRFLYTHIKYIIHRILFFPHFHLNPLQKSLIEFIYFIYNFFFLLWLWSLGFEVKIW